MSVLAGDVFPLYAALAVLSENERYVLLERTLLGRTYHDIGLSMGITRERVRQLHDRAVAKVKRELGEAAR